MKTNIRIFKRLTPKKRQYDQKRFLMLPFRPRVPRKPKGLVKPKVSKETTFKFKYIYKNKANPLEHKLTAQPNATSKFKQTFQEIVIQ